MIFDAKMPMSLQDLVTVSSIAGLFFSVVECQVLDKETLGHSNSIVTESDGGNAFIAK